MASDRSSKKRNRRSYDAPKRLLRSETDTSHFAGLLDLPSELIHLVLSRLSPTCLAAVEITCRLLRDHAQSDHLWQALVNDNVQPRLPSPEPFDSFRKLYTAFHPYWFLVRHRLWFSDVAFCGEMIMARYNRKGYLEAYVVTTERRTQLVTPWSFDPEVLVSHFEPLVMFHMARPFFLLNEETVRQRFKRPLPTPTPGMSTSCDDDRDPHVTLQSVPFLFPSGHVPLSQLDAFDINVELLRECQVPHQKNGSRTQEALWPPAILPAPSRARIALSQQSQRLDYLALHADCQTSPPSQNVFRRTVRQYMGKGVRPSELQTFDTYGTLEPHSYKPTKDRPWRGIFVGDYDGHGCEYIAVMQPEVHEAAFALKYLHGIAVEDPRDAVQAASSDESSDDDDKTRQEDDVEEGGDKATSSSIGTGKKPIYDNPYGMEVIPGDRLVAVKLTGDVNVPRGEITFAVPSISKGVIKIADDEEFRGAPMVHSYGHIASTAFENDRFISTCLIMISHDCLAQYWPTMGHICYYKRVDLDKLADKCVTDASHSAGT